MQLSTIITIRTTENIALPSHELDGLKKSIFEPLIKLIDNDDPEIVDFEVADIRNYSLSTAKWKPTADPEIETYTYISVVMEDSRYTMENFTQLEPQIILEITQLLRQKKIALVAIGTEEVNVTTQIHLLFDTNR